MPTRDRDEEIVNSFQKLPIEANSVAAIAGLLVLQPLDL